MKTIRILLVFLLVGTVMGVSAQKKTKVGTIDSQTLLQMMPEYDSIQKVYEKEYNEMQQTGQQMYADLQKLQQEFVAKQDSMTSFMKSMKKQEIEDLSNRIQTFEQSAQTQLQTIIQQLQQPIIDKIKKAIESVAKENSYTQVIDTATGALLYFDESFDLMPQVKLKLGLIKSLPATPAGGN